MIRAIAAGAAYFALVFGLGFVLGTVRVLLIAPRLGEAGAVLAEAPAMLLASWFVCGWLLDRFPVPAAWSRRLAMGATAFALLMAAELGISALRFGRSVSEHVRGYGSPHALLGLAAQAAFAAFPLIRHRRG